MKKRAGEGDEENQTTQKKRIFGEFVLPPTKDIMVARGYVYGGLDDSGKVLKKLIADALSGDNSVEFFGEPFFRTLKVYLDQQAQFQNNVLFVGLLESSIFVVEPTDAPKKQEPFYFKIGVVRELNTLLFNERPATPRDEDVDRNVAAEPEIVVYREADKFDLKLLWREMSRSNASQEDITKASAAFIDSFHDSLDMLYGERATFKFDRQNIWLAIYQKIEPLVSADQAPAVYVFFDSIVGNMFATLSLDSRSETTFLLYASNDIFETKFGLEATVHEAKARFGFYAKSVAIIELRHKGEAVDLNAILYQRVPLIEKLETKYPRLNKHIFLFPYALMFFEATCTFSFLKMQPSIDKTEFRKFHSVVVASGGKSIISTYSSLFKILWPSEKIEDLEVSRRLDAENDNKLEEEYLRHQTPGPIMHPFRPTSRTIWNNKSLYAEKLRKLVNNHMVGFIALPQTLAAEILWIGMIVYRNFLNLRVRFKDTMQAYGFASALQGSHTEKLILFAARKLTLDREDFNDDEVALSYEEFMHRCIDMASDDSMLDATKTQWEALFSANNRLILGASPRQAELHYLTRKFVAPFGEDEDIAFNTLRGYLWMYLDSCFGVAQGRIKADLYSASVQVEDSLNTLISRTTKQMITATDQSSNEFNLLSTDCDVELFDDVWQDSTLGRDLVWRVGDDPVEALVDREKEKRGENFYMAFDKTTRRIIVREFQGGPTALREQLVLYDHDSALLYAPIAPHRRLRTVLQPYVLRPQPINAQMALDENDRAAEEQQRNEELEERRQQRERDGPGSFRDGTHENQGLVIRAKHNLYPAQHANTAWREVMFLALSVYRKFMQYPRSELQLEERSVFTRFATFVTNNVRDDRSKLAMLEFIAVARKRLTLLLEITANEQTIVAYDKFLDELLSEAVRKADELPLTYLSSYVNNSTKLYEVNRGELPKTLEYLYERMFAVLGLPTEQNAAFTEILSRYIDSDAISDAALTDAILRTYTNSFSRQQKDVALLFVDTENRSELDEIKVIVELLGKYKANAPLFFDDVPLLDVVRQATGFLPAKDRSNYTIFARIQPTNSAGVYSLGALPASYDASAGRPYLIKFTNNTLLEYPFDVEERNIKFVFKT